MIRGWRIVKTRYVATAFSGEGAKRAGGRWNSPGTAIVYVAGSRPMAVLEVLVHLEAADLLPYYSLIGCDIPEELIVHLSSSDLPPTWRTNPPPPEAQSLGDQWVTQATSAVLAVPSVIIPAEVNYLLNPAHPRFGEIHIGAPERFELDARLEARAR